MSRYICKECGAAMTPNWMEGCWEHFHRNDGCRFAGKQDWNGNTDEHFVIAQSTPPEQRAEDDIWSHACKNCGNAEALHLRVSNYWCKKFERGEEFKQDAVDVDDDPETNYAAHPEAVRMPRPIALSVDAWNEHGCEGNMLYSRKDADAYMAHLEFQANAAIENLRGAESLIAYHVENLRIISEALGHPYAGDTSKTARDLAELAATKLTELQTERAAHERTIAELERRIEAYDLAVNNAIDIANEKEAELESLRAELAAVKGEK